MPFNGVRNAASANKNMAYNGERERRVTPSLRDSVHLVADPKNLDTSVDEVFQMMLGAHCRRDDNAAAEIAPEQVTAVVGYGGLLSGACLFRTGGPAAMKIAERMTGTVFTTIDNTVKDGIGEICNMLAGTWKGKLPELAAHCGLSVPAVITGRDYNLHVQAPEFQLCHSYRFEDGVFSVTIICDGLQ